MTDKETKNYYKFYTLQDYDYNIDKAPQYTERISRIGFVNYGGDNLYPDFLISLMNRSAKHNAIVKRKAAMIAGSGFETENLDSIALRFLTNYFNECNLDEIAYKSAYDLEIFGGFSLQIIYSKDKKSIAEINYIPQNKVRLSECKKYAYYSDDWANLRKFIPVKYPLYDPKNPVTTQILYYKEYRPGVEYYSQPGYISSVNWITLEYEISAFHLNQVNNGFAPGMIINFTNGVPSDDEMREVIRQLQADFESARNAGKTMFLFSDGQDRAAQITPVQLNNSDERFIQLNKEITQGILIGHEVTNPQIMGISTPGELGNKSMYLESLEVFQATYIVPKQKQVELVYNKLLKFNGSSSTLTLRKYELDIQVVEEIKETK
jgi:hypothetical protein